MNFDEKVVDRIKKLEREVERLRVKESPDMSSYLGITAKAADSDKLDGLDSASFYHTANPQPTYYAINNTSWNFNPGTSAVTPMTGMSVTFTSLAGTHNYLIKLAGTANWKTVYGANILFYDGESLLATIIAALRANIVARLAFNGFYVLTTTSAAEHVITARLTANGSTSPDIDILTSLLTVTLLN